MRHDKTHTHTHI